MFGVEMCQSHKKVGNRIKCKSCKSESIKMRPCEILSSSKLALFDWCDIVLIKISSVNEYEDDSILYDAYSCGYDLYMSFLNNPTQENADKLWESINKVEELEVGNIYLIDKHFL